MLVKLFQIASDHHLHHLLVGDLFTRKRANVCAIAQHHDAIGDLFNFIQAVRNVDDGDALRTQIVDDFKQARRFCERQTRGRLIHDQDAGVEREGFGDFDHLLTRDGKTRHEVCQSGTSKPRRLR